MDKKQYNRKVFRNYTIIALVFIALSFIGLFFGEWIVPITVTMCSLLGESIVSLLLKSEPGKSSFVVYLLLRYAIMAVGLVLSGFIIKFTMGDEVNKQRYLIMIVSALPYFATSIALSITKLDKE